MLDGMYIETTYSPGAAGMLPLPESTYWLFCQPMPDGGYPFFSNEAREAVNPAREGYILRTRYILVGERYIARETRVYAMDTYGAEFWGTLQ